MKICFLADAASVHSKRWIKYFSREKHEVHWISLTPNRFGKIEGVKFHRLLKSGFKPLDILLNIIPLAVLMRIINPDIFHIHYAGVNGVLGVLSGFHPSVLTVWGSDVLILSESKILKPIIKLVLEKVDLITCDGENTKEKVISLGIPSSKIKLIYFGLDTQKFFIGPKSEKTIKDLNLGEDFIIISMRNLEPVYNIETLINSIPQVLEEISKVKLVIIGKGSEEKKLKKLTKDLKIENNVIFIGFISNDDLPFYLRTADVYVSTSLSDGGIASSTIEAIACGVPVIISDSGDNMKEFKDGENGFIFPVKDSKILAEKIIYLLKNENLKIKFRENGLKIIGEKYDYRKEMGKAEKIYKEIVKQLL